MNRKLLLLLGSLVIMFFTSCEDALQEYTTLDNIELGDDFVIPYLPNTDTTITRSLSLANAIEENLELNQTLDQVEKIQIDSVQINFISANNQENFNFLERANMGVKAGDLDYLDIASISSIPENSESLDLSVEDLYIDDYVSANTFGFVWGLKSNASVDSLKIHARIVFSVKLKILED